jgi:hypothetical protein
MRKYKRRDPSTRSLMVIVLVCISALTLQSCAGNGAGASSDATLAALRTAIAGTATAEEANASNTGDLATAQAEATQRSGEISATQTAQFAGRDTASLATATIAAPIIAELPSYGVNASSGRVGWIHDPLTLDIRGYQQSAYGNDFMNVTAQDFVLAADITWDTQYGDSGCGFMFRSDGNQDKPNQYMVIATRFATGHVVFTALADGELANMQDFYPKSEDRSFDWQNGTTNRIAIVARGNLIEIYTNLIKIGEVDTTQPPKPIMMPATPAAPLDNSQAAQDFYQEQVDVYQEMLQKAQQNYQLAKSNYQKSKAVYTDGFLSMLALTQGGRTVCTFDHAWLWLLNP